MHIPIFIASVLVLGAAVLFIAVLLALVVRARGKAPSAAELQKQAEDAAAAAMSEDVEQEQVRAKLRVAIGEYMISSTLEEYRPAGYFFGLLEMFLVRALTNLVRNVIVGWERVCAHVMVCAA